MVRTGDRIDPGLGAVSVGVGVGLLIILLSMDFPPPTSCAGPLVCMVVPEPPGYYVPLDFLMGLGFLLVALGWIIIVRGFVRGRSVARP